MSVHYDLTSLALVSDAVVLARRTGERKLGPYRTLTLHRVLKSYRGPLRPGEEVDVDYGAYALTPLWGWGFDAGTPHVSQDVVLFLYRNQPSSPDGGTKTTWQLEPSGLRIFVNGAVYRFEQFNNPGPYEPVAQGIDPFDVLEDPRGKVRVTKDQFETELQRAFARAGAIQRALARAGTAAGRQALLDLIGPAPGVDNGAPAAIWSYGFYKNLAERKMLDALAAHHDLKDFLEGVARTPAPDPTLALNDPFTARELLRAARDPRLSLPERVAALQVLTDSPFARLKPADANAVSALLASTQPALRAKALEVAFSRQSMPRAVQPAIARLWKTEHDPRVLCALLDHAPPPPREIAKLAANAPIAWAVRQRRALHAGWRNLSGAPPALKSLRVEVRSKHRVVRTLVLNPNKDLSVWTNSDAAGANGYLDLDGLTPHADYELVAVFELAGASGRAITRRVSLGRYSPVPGTAPELPKPVALAPSAAARTAPAPAAPARKVRSCACSEPAPQRSTGGVLVTLGLLALAFERRKGSRRGARARRRDVIA